MSEAYCRDSFVTERLVVTRASEVTMTKQSPGERLGCYSLHPFHWVATLVFWDKYLSRALAMRQTGIKRGDNCVAIPAGNITLRGRLGSLEKPIAGDNANSFLSTDTTDKSTFHFMKSGT